MLPMASPGEEFFDIVNVFIIYLRSVDNPLGKLSIIKEVISYVYSSIIPVR